MKKKTILTVFVVFLLFFSLINQIVSINALAQEEPIPEKPKGLLQFLGKIASKIFMIFRLLVLTASSNPHIIEIGYNETVILELGIIDLNTNDFQINSGIQLEKSRYLTFDVLEYPSGNEYGKWHIVFDPPIVNVVNGTKVKTNVSVTLRSNRLAEKPIQNGILKIRINDIYVFGNIFRPPKGFPYWDVPIKRSLWTFLAVFIGWGRFYSGKVVTETLDVDILVRVKPVHQVNFYSVPYMVFKPDEVV
ncbi:MAG: hypothetical protein QHH15_03790, partial [Candidatus Thermoplasmatota archaeon]|nr:hypothetical protein [Candidatus Thermoplasmatota archaeon]